MGIGLEIAPLLDVVLTFSAMLGLFAYVYWLAGKEGPADARLDENKSNNQKSVSLTRASNSGVV